MAFDLRASHSSFHDFGTAKVAKADLIVCSKKIFRFVSVHNIDLVQSLELRA